MGEQEVVSKYLRQGWTLEKEQLQNDVFKGMPKISARQKYPWSEE